jgi:type II secretory pathway component GspD/PulD (secretin)
MKRIARRATAGFALVAAASGLFAGGKAFAQEVPVPARPASTDVDKGRGPGEVTIDVVERTMKDVVAYIQDKTEVNLVVSKEAEDIPVTVKLRNLPWREALMIVAERAGAQVDQKTPNLIRIEKPPQVTFEFTNADVREVIKTVADIGGANIVIGREVEGTVSLSLRDVPWRVALDTIVKTLGYTVVQEDRGILRIVDPANLREQLETRIFPLRFVRPRSPYRARIKTDVSVGDPQAPKDDQAGIEAEFNILKAFNQAVFPEGGVTYVKETNALIATGTTPKLEALDKLIGRLDVEPAQVFVDVKFITTKNTDLLDIGMGPGTKGIHADATFGRMTHHLPFRLGKGGWEDHVSAFRTPSGGFGPLPLTDAASAFTFGTLDFSGTTYALNLLKNDVTSRIVQAPKLIALDNQEATIFVGETLRYARTTASSNQSGGLEFSIDEAASSPVQTGFQLLMIPHVIPDKDEVMMTIIPQQSSLSGPDEGGFRRFVSGQQEILLPQVQSSTVVTNMKLDNGQTAVIGGLLQDNESLTINKVPFLGDLPLFGYLFRDERTDKSKANLVIFVTPTIVRDSRHMRDIVVNELRDRQDRVEQELNDIYGGVGAPGPGKAAPLASPAGKASLSGPK